MRPHSFKERCRKELIAGAKSYAFLLTHDFLLSSPKFVVRKQYVIRFNKANYLHLTGVITNLKAADFFDKCLNGTIELGDFECEKDEEIQGKVRHKREHLRHLSSFFNSSVVCQESFKKGKIQCKIVATDLSFTIGFDGGPFYLWPKTLLHKNQLDMNKDIVTLVPEKIKR